MGKKVCVISDATAPDAYFPLWLKYYGGLFGQENLFVVTYGSGVGFEQLGLGGIWVVGGPYEDVLRANLISKLVGALLEVYDVVIRCDVDEFVIPNLNNHKSLRSYIDDLESDYVTAVGVDVFEGSDEVEMLTDLPILGHQRCKGALNSALDKTTLTSVPLEWGPGFHATNNPPVFNDLFIFHFKWADIKARAAWHLFMAKSVISGSPEENYFRVAQGNENGHIQFLRSLEIKSDYFSQLSFEDINRQKNVEYHERPDGLYGAKFSTEFSVFIPHKYGEHI